MSTCTIFEHKIVDLIVVNEESMCGDCGLPVKTSTMWREWHTCTT